MKSREKYIDDIHHIREMMHESSRFISLSGISGILAGTIALIGAYLTYGVVYKGNTRMGLNILVINEDIAWKLFFIAIGTLTVSLLIGGIFTMRRTAATNQPIWDKTTRRFLINMFIPLGTGGLLCLILLYHGYIGLLAPLTLIFYGLGLVNASKYTLEEIRNLGIIEIILGLVATLFIGYGLFFWAAGFGLLHILYGIIMYRKYEA